MHLLTADERKFAEKLSLVTHCNPFLPDRIRYERECLGRDFVRRAEVWSRREDLLDDSPNVDLLMIRSRRLLEQIERRISAGEASASCCETDLNLCSDMVAFFLYHKFQREFDKHARASDGAVSLRQAHFFDEFARDYHHWFSLLPSAIARPENCAHYFALGYQIRRAFNHIFDFVIGESLPAAHLRAAIWQSVFTHDIRRYRRTLFNRMSEFTCLITGPSGTGKELVARAIAQSRYIPFDRGRTTFTDPPGSSFYPVNLSALSPTLIESELFGHRKGSFTGAIQDRAGYLEVCPQLGSVFLDEIGDLEGQIQVKLLRLLQSRTFQRIGDTGQLTFRGKFLAATNRDLAAQMQKGVFREDLYYRLCGDVIVTPSLREQLDDSPDALESISRFIVQKLVGEEEMEPVLREVNEWVVTSLPKKYEWPGNVRELEQCIRNVIVRKNYTPRASAAGQRQETVREQLGKQVAAGELTVEELLRRYCTLVYAEAGSYAETARRLGMDQRTVKGYVDMATVEALR